MLKEQENMQKIFDKSNRLDLSKYSDSKLKMLIEILQHQLEINKCIREGGDLDKLIEERGIKLATPI